MKNLDTPPVQTLGNCEGKYIRQVENSIAISSFGVISRPLII